MQGKNCGGCMHVQVVNDRMHNPPLVGLVKRDCWAGYYVCWSRQKNELSDITGFYFVALDT